MKSRSYIFSVLFLGTLFLVLGCQKSFDEISGVSEEQNSVSLNLHFDKTPGTQEILSNVNKVSVRISGEGLSSPIVKDLAINNNTARGSFDLPFGNKTIDVTASVTNGAIEIPLFQGSRTVNITESVQTVNVDINPLSQNKMEIAFHDDSPEFSVFLDSPGSVLGMAFQTPEPVFIVGIDLFLIWQGEAGPYRLVVFDENFNVLFRSANPIPAGPDGWVSWLLEWANPGMGIIPAGKNAIVGFAYETDFGWPEVGIDVNSGNGGSILFDAAQSQWFAETQGEYLITTVVQTQGGAKRYVTPNRVFTDKLEYENWKAAMSRKLLK